MNQPLDPTPDPSIAEALPYGYEDPRDGRVACTQAELIRRCGSRLLPPRVWTPGSDGLVRPWDVPMLRDAIGERIRGRHSGVMAVGLLVVSGIAVFARDNPGVAAWLLAGVGLAAWLAWNPFHTRLTRDEVRQAKQATRPRIPAVARAGPHTWRDLVPPPSETTTGEYGMVSRTSGEPVPVAREKLIDLVKRGVGPSLVWTPESEGVVPVWRVPFLMDALASRNRRQDAVVPGMLLFTVLYTGSFGLSGAASRTLSISAAVLFAGWVAYLGSARARARGMDAERMERDLNAFAAGWFRQTVPAQWTTAMVGTLAATGLLQVLALTASVHAGAVSMRWLEMGEWWRLLTAPVLHGGVVHWAFNVSALDSLGRMMERRAPRAWLPITFLLAALAGGAASALLPPDGVSVGSSGGLMGLFGFLVVMVRRRRADFPEGFSRALLLNIALIGVVGGIAYAYIDNAAHAGGLAVGLLIGLLAVPSAARTPEWTGGAWLEWAGRLALGVILASAAAAIFVTIRIFLR